MKLLLCLLSIFSYFSRYLFDFVRNTLIPHRLNCPVLVTLILIPEQSSCRHCPRSTVDFFFIKLNHFDFCFDFRKLAGRTLFITGASRGIGKAIALKAARDGANIVVAAKTAEAHPKLPGTIYSAAKESKCCFRSKYAALLI